ncbi:copper-binding protein [Chondromyces apiculatus]|uniref:copper-binding protein n=1 Tax=Chondromyces apiculatus TaxID=51 RepID=UPI0005C73CD7|nr:copper-binding protein [Chondromyces apiculatus]
MRVVSLVFLVASLQSLASLASLSAAVGCGRSSESSQPAAPTISPTAERRTVRGVVKAVHASPAYATIAHEDIPGYMKAMTMDFEVARPALLEGVKAGETVTFTFVESTDRRLVIEAIEAAR